MDVDHLPSIYPYQGRLERIDQNEGRVYEKIVG